MGNPDKPYLPCPPPGKQNLKFFECPLIVNWMNRRKDDCPKSHCPQPPKLVRPTPAPTLPKTSADSQAMIDSLENDLNNLNQQGHGNTALSQELQEEIDILRESEQDNTKNSTSNRVSRSLSNSRRTQRSPEVVIESSSNSLPSSSDLSDSLTTPSGLELNSNSSAVSSSELLDSSTSSTMSNLLSTLATEILTTPRPTNVPYSQLYDDINLSIDQCVDRYATANQVLKVDFMSSNVSNVTVGGSTNAPYVNTTSNTVTQSSTYNTEELLALVQYVSALICFLLGTFGNVLMIAIVIRGMIKMKNKTVHASHIWILNLAVSDLMTVMFSIPLHTSIEVQDNFTFWPWICTATESLSQLCDWVSMLSVFFMATTRAIGVIFPFGFKWLRQKPFNYSAIAGTWITGLFCIIPHLMYMRVDNLCDVVYSPTARGTDGVWAKNMSFAPDGNPIYSQTEYLTWQELANTPCDQLETTELGLNVYGYDFAIGQEFQA